MSAREELREAIGNMFVSQEMAEEYIDDFAHELSERIREAAKTYVGGAFDGAYAAADLIDPKKEK